MSTPPVPEGHAPASPTGTTPQHKGVGCLGVTLMGLVLVGAMLALIALLGDPT